MTASEPSVPMPITPTVSPGCGRTRSIARSTHDAGSTSTPAPNETPSGSRWTTWRGTRTYSP
jgi:hypothetical protein